MMSETNGSKRTMTYIFFLSQAVDTWEDDALYQKLSKFVQNASGQ
jgi:hypothetical protein